MKTNINSRHYLRSALDNGLRIITHGYECDVHEDDWEEGEGDYVNGWNGRLNGSFATKEELYKAIEKEIYLPVNDQTCEFYDGKLCLSWTVNVDNEEPTEEEYEDWKRGEETMYILDMFIPLEVGSATHDMSDEEAESFGLNRY